MGRGVWALLSLAAALGLSSMGYAQGATKPPAKPAVAKPAAVKPAGAKPSAAKPDSDAVARAFLAAEERADIARLATERRYLLSRADWADLGDRCNPGSLRVFPRDESPGARDSLQARIETMERIIVRRGAPSRLDTPEVRALVRTVVGWEAGIDRPVWDADGRAAPREAIATGLTGDVPDPNGPGCLPPAVPFDTVTFVIPGVKDMLFPRAPRPRVKGYFGPEAQAQARSDFFTSVARQDPTAILRYVLVAPIVTWRDYALVAVRRPAEVAGAVQEGDGQGGAVYLFRRVGTGWRLLVIVRSWG